VVRIKVKRLKYDLVRMKESLAVSEGTFEVKAVATFDKVVCRYKGRFPI